MKKSKRQCVIGVYCRKHQFVHGAEAEELRELLEPIAYRDADVRAALNNVDARDSLAYLERRRKPKTS